jgi:septum formation protein
LQVTVIPSDYDEDAADNTVASAPLAALAHARGKARLAHAAGPPVLVAADTVVALGARRLGKPRDAQEAAQMLQTLSGREHVVHTGYVVADRTAGREVSGLVSTVVRFEDLDEDDVAAYVATGDPLDKAGGYGIQGLGALLVRSIRGDFYAVMGLPIARVHAALRELGYRILAAESAAP